MELVMAADAKPGSSWLQALAIAGAEQALQVDRRPPAPLLVLQPCQEWLQPAVEILMPRDTHRHPAPSTATSRGNELTRARFCPSSASVTDHHSGSAVTLRP